MKKERKEKHFVKKPIYEGGPKAIKKFISDNLQYPEEALEKGIEGTVSLKYDIDYKGRVVEVKVIGGLGYGCDEEAIRLVRMLQFQVPRSRGVKVLFHKSMQIHFRLPKQTAKPEAQVGLAYEFVEQKRTDPHEKENKPRKGGYSYTINW